MATIFIPVIALNSHIYDLWRWKHKLDRREYCYISDPQKLRGYEGPVYLLPGYYMSRVYNDPIYTSRLYRRIHAIFISDINQHPRDGQKIARVDNREERGIDMKRGFEIVADAFRQHPEETPVIPQRSTNQSAGYDFVALENYRISPGETYHFCTDIKAYMRPDEVLLVDVRSSMGIKHDLRLVNTIGVIDADYYNNPSNDGQIGIFLKNTGSELVAIHKGDRIAQGIFVNYLTTDNDMPRSMSRVGGIGSTGR